jgi:SAM-dependent methyltransferase
VSARTESEGRGYDDLYKDFDSPLMRQLRLEAYGKDIGQHSWATAEEIEQDIPRLALSRASRFLDLGCGPCGPLAFIAGQAGCHCSGADLSREALAAGRSRAVSLGLDRLITLHQTDLNELLPFVNGSFDAVMSLDVMVHLRDRLGVLREVARVLVSGGRLLFTDAGVITGSVSDEEVHLRSVYGYTQFVPPGFNERLLERAACRVPPNRMPRPHCEFAEERLGTDRSQARPSSGTRAARGQYLF